MKKFVFLHYGFVTPTEEIKEAWGNWFASVGDKFIDMGSPFGSGKEITKDGIKELPLGLDSITGYSIINAENIDEAVKIAETCPFITGIRVYDTQSMKIIRPEQITIKPAVVSICSGLSKNE